MEVQRLSDEVILDVLVNAKKKYSKVILTDNLVGMCRFIDEFLCEPSYRNMIDLYFNLRENNSEELDEWYKRFTGYNYIKEFIPEFVPETFGCEVMTYWWPLTDTMSRKLAFDKLIGIYKEKIKNKENEISVHT